MRLFLLLMLFTNLTFAINGHVTCYSNKKLIFDKDATRIVQDKEFLLVQDKNYTYVIVQADCIIKYKSADLKQMPLK